MTLPLPLESLWDRMQEVRREVLTEVHGLSPAQVEWRPAPDEWSIGEVLHHLTLAEVATGKLATKLLREAETAGRLRPWPEDLDLSAMRVPSRSSPTPRAAPPHLWPKHGLGADQLLAEMSAARSRTRQSLERLGSVDPRAMTGEHFSLGPMHLGQYFALIELHDRLHLRQINEVKTSPGFPPA